MLEREPDLVETVHQAVLAEWIDVELDDFAGGRGHALILQIDGEAIAGSRLRFLEKTVDHRLVEADQKQAVLEAVVEEDIGEARRDHRLKTILEQCPRRVLARRSATEVLAREQDLRAPIARLVENEVRVQRPRGIVHAGLAMVEIPPFVEQVR